MATNDPFADFFASLSPQKEQEEEDQFAGFFASVGNETPSAADPYDDFFRSLTPEKQEPERGLLGTLVSEIGKDITGTVKTVISPFGEVAEMLGMNAPVSFDDITTRDLTGAAMTASMFVGGLLGQAARGVKAGVGAKAALPFVGNKAGRAAVAKFTKDLNFLQRTAQAVMLEGTMGATFGAIKPLEDGESRLNEVLQETAIFGTLGGAFSMLGSAVRATAGAKMAQLKTQKAIAATSLTAKHLEQEQLVREVLGVKLINPERPKSFAGIRRDTEGGVKVTFYDEGKAGVTKKYGDFNEALQEALGHGFITQGGTFRSSLLKSAEFLDEETVKMLEQGGEEALADILQNTRLSQYRAVRQIARERQEAQAHLTDLLAEALTESVDDFGTLKMTDANRRAMAHQIGIKPDELAKMSDPDLLRQGILKGVVDIPDLEHGVAARNWLKELWLNDHVPQGKVILTDVNADAFLTRFRTPMGLGRSHPEVRPLFDLADTATKTYEDGYKQVTEKILYLRETVPSLSKNPELHKTVMRIFDEVAEEVFDANPGATVEQLLERARSMASAKAGHLAVKTGNTDISKAVEIIQPILEDYLVRFKKAGRLSADGGIPGYFPIQHMGDWRLEVFDEAGEAVVQFKGLHAKKEEALAEFERLLQQNPSLVGQVTPHALSFDTSSLGNVAKMNPKQFNALVKAVTEASGERLSASEARDLAGEFGKVIVARAPLKSNPNLRPRKLGLRDYSEDNIVEALERYMLTAERTLAFNTFERDALAVLDTIPAAKDNLKRWASAYTDRILGRPTAQEKAWEALVEWTGADIPSGSLRRYSSMMRKWQSFSKLGGAMSGIVNLTQIPINLYPVLGAKWTAKGMEVFKSRKFRRAAVQELKANGLDLGMYLPLTDEGGFGAMTSVKEALRRYRVSHGKEAAKHAAEAVSNMWLFAFNDAEQYNRVVSAWGAYHRELARGASKSEAALIARDVVERTQFVYRQSNIPEILSSPIGSLLGQFKSYWINEVEFIASLNKTEAMRFGAALASLGGLGAVLDIPGVDMVNAATGIFFDEKADEALKIRSGQGPVAAVTAFGLPGLFNVASSDYIGPGGFADLTRGLLGPTATDAQSFVDFVKEAAADVAAHGRVQTETYNGFVQRVMPAQVRRALRGADIMQTGDVRNPYTHKLVYRPNDRLRTAAQQVIGPPTVQMEQERAMDAVAMRARERYIKARRGMLQEAAAAQRDGDSARVGQILRDARLQGFTITGKDVQRAIMESNRTARERRLRMTPKDIRADLMELYEATGTFDPDDLTIR